MIWTRRRVLAAGGALAGASLTRGARAGVPPTVGGAARSLSLVNLHTAERLHLEYFRGDTYVPASLAALQVLLRDHRNGQEHVIDPKLMDYLHDVAVDLGVEPAFSVISGYRSPETNERLRERSDGVARHSLHLEGRAIDVRLAGVDCADLAERARRMNRGGVGYYRKSDFVHLDTGLVRTWNG